MKTPLQFYLFAFFLVITCSLKAQQNPTDTNTYVVVKNNGAEYIGKILNDDGREILLETKTLGKIYIIKSEIKSITLVSLREEVIFGEYRSQGPFTTRYQLLFAGFNILQLPYLILLICHILLT